MPRSKLIVDNHTATTRNHNIPLDCCEQGATTYLNITVVIPPFNLPCLFLSHRDNMSNPSTPPRSQDPSKGRFSSKPTPLKHNLLESQAHSSGLPPKASTLYKEMTREACDKFVGPMPVNEFLSEFIPEATKRRPRNRIRFSHSSVSQKEKTFVCHRIPTSKRYRRSRIL